MDTNNLEDGIIGLGKGVVNVNSQEFQVLQQMIKQKSSELSEEEKQQNNLFSVKLRMQAYLNSKNKDLLPAGYFLNELIKGLDIKKKIFADYIQTKESNLSALLSGKRKINPDLAVKLGKIFGINPVIWINIQTKNDIEELEMQKKEEYRDFSLVALLEKRRAISANS